MSFMVTRTEVVQEFPMKKFLSFKVKVSIKSLYWSIVNVCKLAHSLPHFLTH